MNAMRFFRPLFGSAAQLWALPMIMVVLLAPVTARGEYLLAPGDVLEIDAVGIPDLRHRAMIDLNGQISFPLIGDINAAGLSVPELRKQVKSILSTKAFRPRELDRPGRSNSQEEVVTIAPDEVTLTVAEYRPIYLNGDVANPGTQSYRPGMTVRQAIALAGGYDTMRFRGRDPFLDSSDFRGDYYELWTEFAKVRAQAARFQAELDAKSTLGQLKLNDLPLPAGVTSTIADVEAQRLSVDNSDHEKEKQYLENAVREEEGRIATLRNQRETEQADADADAAELKQLQATFTKGLVPMTRLSDSRRMMLFSATRVLQTTALMDQVQRERSEFARRLQRVQDQRRDNLLAKLQDANVRLATIRARLQAVGDKLLYAGVVRSQLARGSGGDPVIKVYRDNNDTLGNITADEETKLMPGDVVEVRLRLEGLPKFTDSGSPASARDEDQKEAAGARK
ncbi:polysaccharide biosynthesis/export family protein [Bradyrhizobium sp. ARR65]|uniref:polysaccharide biosynthesis/export family protein n=1 Tax=Bradyrhizobium sp. ARR65 TaxID=1040989 RepID=UPI0004651F15|nr:polysaccharide biosynthesis/export family protein [Bradyrhizobium sp. ARR65]